MSANLWASGIQLVVWATEINLCASCRPSCNENKRKHNIMFYDYYDDDDDFGGDDDGRSNPKTISLKV